MADVILFANTAKQDVKDAVDRIMPWLSEQADVTLVTNMEGECAQKTARFVAVVGGDGTMLNAARKFSPLSIPIIGINVGKFGFLTQATVEESRNVLQQALDGNYRTVTRMMLRCCLLRDGEMVNDSIGLNDAVISRTSLSRLLTIDLFVNEELVSTYRADGLILSTPVGSTAHSLAASGPILMPELKAFVISPICPHTLSNRPLVLPPEKVIELRPRDYAEKPALTVDGQLFTPLQEDDIIRVTRAEVELSLIDVVKRSFFETLRNKLGWSGQPQYVKKQV
jgi:NAD+ kinase